jgi:hypothetical protein
MRAGGTPRSNSVDLTSRMNGKGPQVKTWTSFGSGMSDKSMKPLPRAGVALIEGFVPGIRTEVVDLSSEMQHGVSQCVILGSPVCMGDYDGSLGLGTSNVFDNG